MAGHSVLTHTKCTVHVPLSVTRSHCTITETSRNTTNNWTIEKQSLSIRVMYIVVCMSYVILVSGLYSNWKGFVEALTDSIKVGVVWVWSSHHVTCRVPEFTDLWYDIITLPSKLAQNFTGTHVHAMTTTLMVSVYNWMLSQRNTEYFKSTNFEKIFSRKDCYRCWNKVKLSTIKGISHISCTLDNMAL